MGRHNVFLAGEMNMEKQKRLEDRPFALLIMSAIDWPVIRPHIHKIPAALDDAQPRTVSTIDCGVLIPRLKRQAPTPNHPGPSPVHLP
jgi:hypothetical protein